MNYTGLYKMAAGDMMQRPYPAWSEGKETVDRYQKNYAKRYRDNAPFLAKGFLPRTDDDLLNSRVLDTYSFAWPTRNIEYQKWRNNRYPLPASYSLWKQLQGPTKQLNFLPGTSAYDTIKTYQKQYDDNTPFWQRLLVSKNDIAWPTRNTEEQKLRNIKNPMYANRSSNTEQPVNFRKTVASTR